MLWLWTVLASDASWLIITAFWLVVGGTIALGVRRDIRAHAGQESYEGAKFPSLDFSLVYVLNERGNTVDISR